MEFVLGITVGNHCVVKYPLVKCFSDFSTFLSLRNEAQTTTQGIKAASELNVLPVDLNVLMVETIQRVFLEI